MTNKEAIVGLGVLGLFLTWMFKSDDETIDTTAEVVEEPKALSGIAGGRDVEAGGLTFTRINNDVNGNPRYVIHFLNLLKDGEKGYETALKRAKKIGGRKFHNKQYGGGIVFQSYNINDTAKHIKETLADSKKLSGHKKSRIKTRDHRERQPDEIWVGNTKTKELLSTLTKFKSLKTLRVGQQAFDIRGKKLNRQYMKPLFVNKSEENMYDKIMMTR